MKVGPTAFKDIPLLRSETKIDKHLLRKYNAQRENLFDKIAPRKRNKLRRIAKRLEQRKKK